MWLQFWIDAEEKILKRSDRSPPHRNKRNPCKHLECTRTTDNLFLQIYVHLVVSHRIIFYVGTIYFNIVLLSELVVNKECRLFSERINE